MNVRLLVSAFVLVIPICCAAQDPQSAATKTEDSSPVAVQTDADPISPGQLVHKVIPKYPKEAKKKKLQGRVVLAVTVEPTGSVNGIAFTGGDLLFIEEAVDAVRDWNFEPYTQAGKPVKVLQILTFDFDPDKKQAELEPLPPATLASIASQTLLSVPGTYLVGAEVSAPRAVHMPDPQYSEKARKAKYQGTCVLALVVGENGKPRNIRVARALGEGLDEKAIEAVQEWRFKPAMKDGKPVAVAINVEMTFRLY